MKIVPVITLCPDHTLDTLLLPYLMRLTDLLMVSYPYAVQAAQLPEVGLMIDSGGFASTDPQARVEREGEAFVLCRGNLRLHPLEVLEFQAARARVGFTLDFLVLPDLPMQEKKRRFEATLANAHLALRHHPSGHPMELYASLQAWDVATAREAASHYRELGFTAMGIGGLVPHARNPAHVRELVKAAKDAAPGLKIHAFGLGSPANTRMLLELGVDSADSSSYVRRALEGEDWTTRQVVAGPQLLESLGFALGNLQLLLELTAMGTEVA